MLDDASGESVRARYQVGLRVPYSPELRCCELRLVDACRVRVLEVWGEERVASEDRLPLSSRHGGYGR